MSTWTDFDVPSLAALLAAAGHKPSQAGRLLGQFYRGHGCLKLDVAQYGKDLMAWLEGHVAQRSSRILRRHCSEDGTVKFLVGFDRGGAVETVLMPAHRPDRAAGCVSSQIGCAMGCDFCASTRQGLERDLSAGEIVEQFLILRAAAAGAGRRLATLVFMGMGEPMHNLDNVLAAIDRISRPQLGNLGRRAITVSTVGIIPGIERLMEADLGVHLAVSLHAPDDLTRRRIVPMGRRYGVMEIISTARRFEAKTGRPVTIEYCLLAGVNDSDAQAHQLADLARGWPAHVNLIPYNTIGPGLRGVIYRRPDAGRMERFLEILRTAGIPAHFRQTRGDEIHAACGQLRVMA